MKQILKRTLKLKRSYTKNDLKELGVFLDKTLENRESKNTEFGKYFYAPRSLNYNDANEVVKWVKLASRQGPDVILGNYEQPSAFIITVTGAAGQIAYNLLPRICSGEMFGPKQRIILHLVEVPEAMKALEGIKMELEDCAFPLLEKLVITSDLDEGFERADYCILLGGKPRKVGQERKDMLTENAASYVQVGKVINRRVNSNCNIVVVANPCNTNAMVLAENAPDLDPKLVTALTRLDHDRGVGMIANKLGVSTQEVDRFAVWGNHSNTQCPDFNNVTIGGKWMKSLIKDEEWLSNTLVPSLQQRGAAVLAARGKSSASSTATSIMNHLRDLLYGSNKWQSMAVRGNGQYGVPNYLWSSYPVVTKDGTYEIVDRIEFTAEVATLINKSIKELHEEREAVKHLLPGKKYQFTTLEKEVFSWRFLIPETSPELIQIVFNNDKVFNGLKALYKPLLKGDKVWKNTEFKKKKFTFDEIKEVVQGADVQPKDTQTLMSAVERAVSYELELIKQKYQNFLMDLKEIKDETYLKLSNDDKIKYHLHQAKLDGVLNEEGINGVQIFKNLLSHHFK